MSRYDAFSPPPDDDFPISVRPQRDPAIDFETRRRQNEARHVEMLRKEHATYAHCHEILVAADIDAEAQPVHVTLYDWSCHRCTDNQNPSKPSPSAIFSIREPGSALATLKGFFDLGTIRLPDDATSAAALLVDEEQDDEYDFCDDAGSDAGSAAPARKTPSLPELVLRVRRRLASQKNASKGRPVQLWTFPVQSRIAENVFGDKRKRYLWNWYKPTSPYSKRGMWETQLDAVLENGSWMAGKDLTLVMRSVPDEVWQGFADGSPPLDFFFSEDFQERE